MVRRHRKKRPQPAIGTVFERQFKGRNYSLTVVRAHGGVAFRVGETLFTTPSRAAKHITGTEVNGWVFWKIDQALAAREG